MRSGAPGGAAGRPPSRAPARRSPPRTTLQARRGRGPRATGSPSGAAPGRPLRLGCSSGRQCTGRPTGAIRLGRVGECHRPPARPSRSAHTTREQRGCEFLIFGGGRLPGWPTAMRFSGKGNDVAVVDDFSRRRWHEEAGTDSLTPIASLDERIDIWRGRPARPSSIGGRHRGEHVHRRRGARVRPETIVHYGEQPSAPWSMKNVENRVVTQLNNVVGTSTCCGRCATSRPTPTSSSSARWASTARPTSTSKRARSRSSTTGARTRCRSPSAGLASITCPRCTTATTSSSPAGPGACAPPTSTRASSTASRPRRRRCDPRLATRFDYDEVFGTALNRFCVQAGSDIR